MSRNFDRSPLTPWITRCRKAGWKRSRPNPNEFVNVRTKLYAAQRCAEKAAFSPHLWEAACQRVSEKLLHLGQVCNIDLDRAAGTLGDLNTSPGTWLDANSDSGYSKVFSKKADVPMPSVRFYKRHLISGGKLIPSTVAFRTHVSKKHKVRAIYVPPAAHIIIEHMFTAPLMGLVKQKGINQLFGTCFSYFKGHHRCYLSEIANRRVLSLDISDFDLSFLPWQIRSAFAVLRKLLILTGENEIIWNRLVEYFIHTPVLHAGRVYILPGVLSGSGFTHLLGDVINAIVIECLEGESPAWYRVYGDDSILVTDKPISYYVSRAKSMGIKINPTKSREGIDWLGYRLDSGKPKVIDVEKRFASLFNPPNPDLTDSSFIGRILGHLFSSLGDSRIEAPLLEALDLNDAMVDAWMLPTDIVKYLKFLGYVDVKDAWRRNYVQVTSWINV